MQLIVRICSGTLINYLSKSEQLITNYLSKPEQLITEQWFESLIAVVDDPDPDVVSLVQ